MARKHRGGHHGGAWKVAYADFVTAMMALFMVLWISAQDQEILIATSRYFLQPFTSTEEDSTGAVSMNKAGGGEASVMDAEPSSLANLEELNRLAQEFTKMLNLDDTVENAPVDIQVTNDGLRVTLFNRADRPLFQQDTAEFTDWGSFVVENLAWLVGRDAFKVRIDGHSAQGFASARSGYSAWDLSADRANATRRLLHHFFVADTKFERVTGFGDTVPFRGRKPDDPANDRVELSLVVLPPVH